MSNQGCSKKYRTRFFSSVFSEMKELADPSIFAVAAAPSGDENSSEAAKSAAAAPVEEESDDEEAAFDLLD